MSKKKKALRLAHISDTHIRNLKFHDDYRAVFEHLYEILREEKPDYIVHCGDVAHTKTQLSPEFFEMAANFFDKLSDIAPLVLIAGNHDGNLKNSSRQDALTPIINALDKDTIHYLKNSGEFSPCKGLTFNVLSVFDRDNWVEPFGDMRQELVFIGQGLDQQAIIRALDQCLLNEEDVLKGKEFWQTLTDPFPAWQESA